MRETQHESMIDVGEAQEDAELYQIFQGWPIVNELDLGWFHMHPMFVHDVS
jgi:hypothetical protein